MKLVNRQELMKLPPGVLYFSYNKNSLLCLDSLMVKEETIVHNERNIDFFFIDLMRIYFHDTGDLIEKIKDMETNGTSYPMNETMMRDGSFDDEETFIVLEKEDLTLLKGYIEKSLDLLR